MMPLIQKAYHAGNFRKKGHRLVDELADYLEQTTRKKEGPVFKQFEPDTLFRKWDTALNNPQGNFKAWVQNVIDDSIHIHHPGYMGHQVSPSLPDAVLAEFLGAMLNNGVGVYEMGSPTVAMERAVIKKLATQIGFGETADGFLTSGGTLGNLTALLGMRQVMAENDTWNEGDGEKQFGIMVSAEAHYSISRAVKIMGWGERGIIKIPTDEKLRLDAGTLEKYYSEAQKKGIDVLGIIGNACSTATGSFDPLNEIANFCESHNLWFHIDAAHGGGAIFSMKYKYLLDGINRADSVIVDFHKMLMCPALVTGLVFKNGRDSYKSFAQKASYLWEKEDPEWFNLGKRTFECTKDMMALKVYAILREYGTDLFGELIDYLFDLGRTFGQMIRERPHFELLIEPSCNILCFRFVPDTANAPNELNQYIREQLLEDGTYFIVQTNYNGKLYLRTTLMNPFTRPNHLGKLLDEIEKIGSEYPA
ncbi:MAG: aminotransferase class I/II-fold pyridoxal phosphate-dependent enzyme [Balneolaceae bacterium]|jgi:L-2,4-diaminobutyrate decarboxylase